MEEQHKQCNVNFDHQAAGKQKTLYALPYFMIEIRLQKASLDLDEFRVVAHPAQKSMEFVMFTLAFIN